MMDWTKIIESVVSQLVPVVVSVISIFVAYAAKTIASKMEEHYPSITQDAKKKQLEDYILAAVNNVNREFVETAKEMSSDGKLTAEERQKAMSMAKDQLTGFVYNTELQKMLIDLGEEWITAKINYYVGRLK